jgi:hypothetical protein
MLLEKKGIVEKGGLLRQGGILEDAGLMRKSDLTEEQAEKARNFSLEEHLRPAMEKLTEESNARKKAMAAGKLAKEKEKERETEIDGVSKRSDNRARVVAKFKKINGEEYAPVLHLGHLSPPPLPKN